MGGSGHRPKHRKLVICPDHGNSPYLWNGEGGGVVADGAYFYGSEPVSSALWADFADWMRGFTDAAHSESGFPPSWSWEEFHRVGQALAHRLKEEVGLGCEVIYQAPIEDPSEAAGQRTRLELR